MKRGLLIFLLFPIIVFSQTYTGKVIRVIDGDIFVFQTKQGAIKVRMSGIDAPEHDQVGGEESKYFLEGFIKKDATLNWQGIDQYGRTLGILFVNSKNINLEMVRSGNAWHYKKYSSDPELDKAEKYARQNKLGLWKYPNPIAPWDFQHTGK